MSINKRITRAAAQLLIWASERELPSGSADSLIRTADDNGHYRISIMRFDSWEVAETFTAIHQHNLAAASQALRARKEQAEAPAAATTEAER